MVRINAIVPAYNEEKNIKATLTALKKSKYITGILVIDDGSKDDTYRIVKEMGINIIKLNKNYGKGKAIKEGLVRLIDFSDIICFFDADIGDSAKEADKLILPVLKGEGDVVIGRFINKGSGGFGLVKKLSKYGVKFFTGRAIESVLSGQRVFKAEVLKKINNIPGNYGIEVSMTIDVLKLGYSILEVPVNMYHEETKNNLKGFLHRGRQFVQVLFTLIGKLWE